MRFALAFVAILVVSWASHGQARNLENSTGDKKPFENPSVKEVSTNEGKTVILNGEERPVSGSVQAYQKNKDSLKRTPKGGIISTVVNEADILLKADDKIGQEKPIFTIEP